MHKFFLYEALGNDYLVLDPSVFSSSLTPVLIRSICDRNIGVGSDGILWGPQQRGETFGLRIFNPDGTEAEKSGNGLRIFGRYLFDAGYAMGIEVAIAVGGDVVRVERSRDDPSLLSADLGKVRVEEKTELKIDGSSYTVHMASVGNPHCVLFIEKPTRELAERLGPRIERNVLFPNRTNVQFVRVVDRKNLQMEIWERGAGYTLASGTSSAAAASVCHALGKCEPQVVIHMPGGQMEVELNDNHAIIRGPVRKIAEGELDEQFVRGP